MRRQWPDTQIAREWAKAKRKEERHTGSCEAMRISGSKSGLERVGLRSSPTLPSVSPVEVTELS